MLPVVITLIYMNMSLKHHQLLVKGSLIYITYKLYLTGIINRQTSLLMVTNSGFSLYNFV